MLHGFELCTEGVQGLEVHDLESLAWEANHDRDRNLLEAINSECEDQKTAWEVDPDRALDNVRLAALSDACRMTTRGLR